MNPPLNAGDRCVYCGEVGHQGGPECPFDPESPANTFDPIEALRFRVAWGSETDVAWDNVPAVDAFTVLETSNSPAQASTHVLDLYLIDRCSPKCLKGCPSCQPRWSDLPSVEDEDNRVAKLEKTHGIVMRRDPTKSNKVIKVEIHNTIMKNLLATVFEGYPGFYPSLLSTAGAWVFRDPFMIFVHRWEQLVKHGNEALSPDERDAWFVLVDAMKPVVESALGDIQKIQDTGLVTWHDLELIFAPGEFICIPQRTETLIVRLTSMQRKKQTKSDWGSSTAECWHLQYEFIDWNGLICGLCTESTSIRKFDNHHEVSSLKGIPLKYVPNFELTKTRLIARGRKWEALMGIHFRFFDGKKNIFRAETDVRAKGRIVIDAEAYYDRPNECKPPLKPLTKNPADPSSASTTERAAERVRLSDEQCLITSSLVHGFDLKNKQWCRFPVENVSDITFNPLAFEKLVMPPSEKKLAWAFVESKKLLGASASSDSAVFDDFIEGKGRGLCMLLCGPPGVGKTYTAEAITEKAEVPLYMVSAGELGTEPSQVDGALDQALELCRRWGAMLLLDEADVFLGKRGFGGQEASVLRNELVSIFLRRLEYFQGTMFLTTNRIQNIDDAFQSRIDLILPYSDLDPDARLQVWNNFIEKSGGDEKFDLLPGDIKCLADYPLNGREIKNLVKSALLIAGKVGDDGEEEAVDANAHGHNEDGEVGPAKVTMGILKTLAGMRVRAHKLMGEE